MIVVLDTGVLGSITNPNQKSSDVKAMIAWAGRLRAAGHVFAIPAIADYETRRELLRTGSTKAIAAHDAFCNAAGNLYLSISDAALVEAARLWAQARNMGRQTAANEAIDGDVILCAQVLQARYAPGSYVVATTNTKHLTLFATAAEWHTI